MFRNQRSISNYYQESFRNIQSEIIKESDETIIGTNPEELAEYYFQKHHLKPIVIDETIGNTINPQKYVKTIYEHQRDSFYQSSGDLEFECEKIDLEIPLIMNENIHTISELQSSTYSVSFSAKEFSFYPNKIKFTLDTKGYNFALNEQQIKQQIESQIDKIKNLISWKNNDIEKENSKFKSDILDFIS